MREERRRGRCEKRYIFPLFFNFLGKSQAYISYFHVRVIYHERLAPIALYDSPPPPLFQEREQREREWKEREERRKREWEKRMEERKERERLREERLKERADSRDKDRDRRRDDSYKDRERDRDRSRCEFIVCLLFNAAFLTKYKCLYIFLMETL